MTIYRACIGITVQMILKIIILLAECAIDNIFEEIADVEIMLEQCKIMFQCDKEVNKWQQKKIERLERRLEGGN